MAFPERIGPIRLADVPRVARRCQLYANRNGAALVAVDHLGVCWVTWPHNSAARKILAHMPETVIGTFARGVECEAVEWELYGVAA